MNIRLSKKQENLLNDIISPNKTEIYVLGSTQSGKTFDICLATLMYAQALYNYNPNETYFGSITGWSLETLKGNILEPIKKFLDDMGLIKSKDYILKWQTDEKYLEIYNIRYYFFGFNNVLAFNKILGKPLIFEWIDESARIYSQDNLREPFNEFPGRQVSYANHPYLKTIHSFNVEGGENHPYKVDYIDNKPNAIHYTFLPYDNPKLDTEEAIRKVLEMFPPGSLRDQKIFCKWILASGRVFNQINVIDNLQGYVFREIGIGIDYGSVNATTFVPIALVYDKNEKKWKLIRLEIYYHDTKKEKDSPTTEYYSHQLRLFLLYLKQRYPHVPITTCVIDSEATHYHNRLIADNIPHTLAKKGAGSVNEGVQHLQSLIYKGYYYVYKQNSIKHMNDDGTPQFSGKDEGIVEFESYRYDTVRSAKTGIDCYVKEFDHCLIGDTLVNTPKGNIPIKELVNTKGKVYCYDGNKIVKSNYYNCRMTQENVDIYELELSNGYKIRGTYEHPILTKNGYVMLGELKDTDEVVCI